MVKELNVVKDTSRHPIFQVIFGIQNFGNLHELNNLFKPYKVENSLYEVAKFDISTFIEDSESQLKGSFNYATSLYDEATIVRFKESYVQILRQLVNLKEEKEANIYDLNYLTSQQYQQVIYDWNATEKEYPSDKTLQSLFEEQVERTPNNIAVVYGDIHLTYKELNDKANQLSHYLRSLSEIKPDTLIALCLDRSEQMLIAILGVLKAGAAYVPLEASYPDDRLAYVLEDTQAYIVITQEYYHGRLKALVELSCSQLTVLAIESLEVQSQLYFQPSSNPETITTSSHLAYVIYTSGTTGQPKGVMIQHGGIINRIQWMNNTYPLNERDRILQKTPYVFDVSVWELLWANWVGACVVFIKFGLHKDIKSIIDCINQKSITVIHFVPSMLSSFESELSSNMVQENLNHELSTLKYVFCSGEALNLSQIRNFHALLPNVEIHNLYGPTEASIDVTYYSCIDKNIGPVCIGKPIDNAIAYVLDSSLKPLPIGAIGELYIGGVGLARGYLNKADLTAEKFIANPFQTEFSKAQSKNSRLYKTGDLVRLLADGNLEYIGRNDFQVKIRGLSD